MWAKNNNSLENWITELYSTLASGWWMKKHRRLIEDSEVINFRVVLVARMYVKPSPPPNFPNENSPESSHMVQYRQTINNFLIAPFCPHTTRHIRHHFFFLLFIWKTSVVVTGWKLWDVGTRWRKDIPSPIAQSSRRKRPLHDVEYVSVYWLLLRPVFPCWIAGEKERESHK